MSAHHQRRYAPVRVVALELGELPTVGSPAFGGEPVFLVVSLKGDVLGACFVPPMDGPRAVADHLAVRLGYAWRERVVAGAVGDARAWRDHPPAADVGAVTVVVCTMDRPVHLRRCLDSVLPQLAEGDELIVVDNSAGGSGRRVAEAVGGGWLYERPDARTPGGARWVSERRRGSSRVRNRGWREATTPLVVYIDDDCVADREWLLALRQPFSDPGVDAATGAVLGRRADLRLPMLLDERYPFFRGWAARDFHGDTGTDDTPFEAWQVGTGASMAWRRSALERLGGFDAALGAGTPTRSREELDLFRRALAGGATIAYRPAALVWHDHPETLRALRRTLICYAIGAGAVAAKVMLEEGRRRPLRLVAHEARWQLHWAGSETWNFVTGRPRFPLLALLSYAPAAGLGAVRFLRHRHGLRGPA